MDKAGDQNFRYQVALLWHELSRVPRETLFGPTDKFLPKVDPDNARIPAPGWVGPRYEPSGVLIIGANPGGGGDRYKRNATDDQLYRSFAELRDASGEGDIAAAFERMSALYLIVTAGHNVVLPLKAAFAATGLTAEDCAFMNTVPFRTREDDWPYIDTRKKSLDLFVRRQIEALRPGTIIYLGMKGADDIERFLDLGPIRRYFLKRNIGDNGLHKEAVVELQRMTADFDRARKTR